MKDTSKYLAECEQEIRERNDDMGKIAYQDFVTVDAGRNAITAG